MRFSSLTVVISAVLAVPVAARTLAPMQGAAFLQSTRVAAVESVAREAGFDPARVNAEARRHGAANVEAARAATEEVAMGAGSQDHDALHLVGCNAA